jgi:cytochrome c-type biogenesis protein CcmH
MTLFWLLAAALIALALALVLPALLKQQALLPDAVGRADGNRAILREQLAQLDAELASGDLSAQQYAQALAELQQRALEEDGPAAGASRTQPGSLSAVLMALAIPALALTLYGLLGNTQALQPRAAVSQQGGGEPTEAEVEAMVARLAQRLNEAPAGAPADPQAWEMLARSYAALRRFPEAGRAYERAAQLAPGNAQLVADHADILAMMQGQKVEGEALRLVERALVLDPNNLKALALAGSGAYGRQDYAAAMVYWGKAEALAPADSEIAQYLARSVAETRQAMGGSPIQVASTAKAEAKTAAVHGLVQLAPALAARVAPGDTVFIFARAAQGPRMPLAILRHQASELPIRFTLDDSTAMAAETQLSRFAQVVVFARISRSGNALPQSGDLVGQVGPIATGGKPATLTIDSVQP